MSCFKGRGANSCIPKLVLKDREILSMILEERDWIEESIHTNYKASILEAYPQHTDEVVLVPLHEDRDTHCVPRPPQPFSERNQLLGDPVCPGLAGFHGVMPFLPPERMAP